MSTSIQTDTEYNFISDDGDKSISISKLGLNFKRDLLTTPIETIITPLDITDVNTGNSITMDRLTYLPIGLAALEAPPNPTTLHIQDTLLVDKLLSDVSNIVAWDSITIEDTSGGPGNVIKSQLTDALLSITNNSAFGSPNTTNVYAGTITLLSDTIDNCALSANGLQFNVPSSGNTNSVYNTGGTDLNVTGSNQLNLAAGDNVNLYPGVNCLIQTNGIGNGVLINTQDGLINMGDFNQIYNRTYTSLDDNTKQIITNTPDGLIWSGDINAIGSTATVQFNVAHRFQSVFAGRMSNTEEINITVGNHAEAYSNYFVTDTDVRFYPRIDYENPLTPNGDGWFCYITNITGIDIFLTADDGLPFLSRSIGGFNTTGDIGKFETVRVSLSYHTTTGYFWAVLQGA
jgi:hypothetical protein